MEGSDKSFPRTCFGSDWFPENILRSVQVLNNETNLGETLPTVKIKISICRGEKKKREILRMLGVYVNYTMEISRAILSTGLLYWNQVKYSYVPIKKGLLNIFQKFLT